MRRLDEIIRRRNKMEAYIQSLTATEAELLEDITDLLKLAEAMSCNPDYWTNSTAQDALCALTRFDPHDGMPNAAGERQPPANKEKL